MDASLEALLTREYFHGSDKDLPVLKPVGINMGHRWAKPEWAIFFWGSEDKARKWAVYQYCRRNTKSKMMYHIPTGKFAIMADSFKEVVSQVLGKTTFVYSATLPRLSVGYGSSPDIEEYTYNKEVVPDTKSPIKLTRAELTANAIIMTEAEYSKYRSELISGMYAGGRGLLFRIIMDSERDQMRHKYHDLVKEGKLKPGDSLDDVSFESLPPAFKW